MYEYENRRKSCILLTVPDIMLYSYSVAMAIIISTCSDSRILVQCLNQPTTYLKTLRRLCAVCAIPFVPGIGSPYQRQRQQQSAARFSHKAKGGDVA